MNLNKPLGDNENDNLTIFLALSGIFFWIIIIFVGVVWMI